MTSRPARPARAALGGKAAVDLGEAAHWTLRLTGGPVPARLAGRDLTAEVPGCVHTDLMRHGVIPDPYLDQNEADLTWLWRTSTRYRATLPGDAALLDLDGDLLSIDHALVDCDDEYRLDLVCEGLDTFATVTLNGVELGHTANQHRSYRFDARQALAAVREGSHALQIDFADPLGTAESWSRRLGFRPQMGNLSDLPFNAVRKMACNFGWDWGPVLLTSGVYKPLRLEAWRVARLARVLPRVGVKLADAAAPVGTIDLGFALEYSDGTAVIRGRTAESDKVPMRVTGQQVRLRAAVTDAAGQIVASRDLTCAHTEAEQRVTVEVENPRLWWPLGFGQTTPEHGPDLYRLTVELLDHDSTVLDRSEHEIGFRTVEVVQAPDEHGSSFELRVNGELVFVRGANWIPADCFPHRVTHALREHLIGEAIAGNLNLLRVWGGGLYESDDFYSICNRRGMLVWQDFAFACAAYAEEPPLALEVEAEARENIARLVSHPALVMWNGGNENVEGYYHWDWQETLAGRTWGRGYYTELFPRLLAELDGTRPYIPSSPFNPHDETDPRNPSYGTVHHWEVWNSQDYTHYASFVPRFCAEFGFQGPANWGTVVRSMRAHDTVTGVPERADHPVLLAHQKALDGQAKLERGYAPHLPQPKSFAAWHWTTQLNQAHALRFGISHFRRHVPVCTGTVVWQLNDCWPVTSWAAIDGDYTRKPLWYALREVYRDHVASIGGSDGAGGLPELVLSNVSRSPWRARGQVVLVDAAGTGLASHPFDTLVTPGSVARVPLPAALARPEQPTARALVLAAEGEPHGLHLFVPDKDFAFEAPRVEARVVASEPGAALSPTATPAANGADPTQGTASLTVRITAQTLLKDVMLEPAHLHPDLRATGGWVNLGPGHAVDFVLRATSASGLAALSALAADPAPLATWPTLRSVNHLLHQ